MCATRGLRLHRCVPAPQLVEALHVWTLDSKKRCGQHMLAMVRSTHCEVRIQKLHCY